MNPSFKLKYDQMRGNDPTGDEPKQAEHLNEIDEFYKAPSDNRNIAFVWQDGRRLCLNYGFLIHHEYDPQNSRIILSFTSHIITLTGINLVNLFYDLMQRLPRQIVELNKRYDSIQEENITLIYHIVYESKSDIKKG